MTQEDRNFIVQCWEAGGTIGGIVKLLPYKKTVARRMILELRNEGAIKGRSGKTREKTKEIVLWTYQEKTHNPYEIAELLGYAPTTVQDILNKAKLNRKRPPKNYKHGGVRPIERASEKTQKIFLDIQSGMSMREISKKHDVSTQYVYDIKKRYIKE